MKDKYLVTFNFISEMDKCIRVQKKTKKMNKVFFIPKSIIIESKQYIQEKNLCKDVKYERKRIAVSLPKWYCDKELGFYI